MVEQDLRIIALVILAVGLVMFSHYRAEQKRYMRRLELATAARQFADAIADFSEGRS